MSYDLELYDPATEEVCILDAPHQMKGGTYVLGGTDKAELNITHNYCKHFQRVLGEEGIRTIYGMTGAESIPLLNQAIQQLGDDYSEDYWAATEGNAKRALRQVKALAQLRPDGVWQGD